MTITASYIIDSLTLHKESFTKNLSMVGVTARFLTLSWYSIKIRISSTHFFKLQPVDKNQRSLQERSHLGSSLIPFSAM